MAHKQQGQFTTSGEWAKHLRPLHRREFWKQEKRAVKAPCGRMASSVDTR